MAATTKLSPPELHMENPATWPDEDDELEEAAHAAQQAPTPPLSSHHVPASVQALPRMCSLMAGAQTG